MIKHIGSARLLLPRILASAGAAVWPADSGLDRPPFNTQRAMSEWQASDDAGQVA